MSDSEILPREYFGPIPCLEFYFLILLTSDFTVEIILYFDTYFILNFILNFTFLFFLQVILLWRSYLILTSKVITCFTFRYFRPRKESHHCFSSHRFYFPPFFPCIIVKKGKVFSKYFLH